MDDVVKQEQYLALIDALNDAEALRQEIIERYRALEQPWADTEKFEQIMADWDAADVRIHEARDALRAAR